MHSRLILFPDAFLSGAEDDEVGLDVFVHSQVFEENEIAPNFNGDLRDVEFSDEF